MTTEHPAPSHSRLRTRDGREVHLHELSIRPIGGIILEGRPSRERNHRELQGIYANAVAEHPGDKVHFTVDPAIIPHFAIIMGLNSRDGARETDPDYCSWLRVVSAAPNLELGVDDTLRALVEQLDWSALAQDERLPGL